MKTLKTLLVVGCLSCGMFARAQTCEPEVPMQCAFKPVAQWIAEQTTLRCTPNPAVPGGETITKCEPTVPWYNPYNGTYCVLDVLAQDSYGSTYSKGTAVYPNCPPNASGSSDYTLNSQTGTCVKYCPTPPDLLVPDPPNEPPLSCPKSGSPSGDPGNQDGATAGNPISPPPPQRRSK